MDTPPTAALPSTEFVLPNKSADVENVKCVKKCSPILLWIVCACVLSMIALFIFYGSHDEYISSFVGQKEKLEEGTLAACPEGYKLSGDMCYPDDNGPMKQTCPSGGTPINDGICRIRKQATCPDGYHNIGTHCEDLKTNRILPISDATCAEGETKEGGLCVSTYLGECLPYYKNTGSGVDACVQEFESMSPQCKTGETLKGGRCYTSSVESFARANEIEAQAIASLNI